ncbi:hypothetical protein [Cohnella cellulosilytica]|uniref:Uncharacterized protein n=1 Tax=Cohnella cellulosilytica TaxID=986710 RepID=A0ABW2F9Y3_9BACL
MSRKTAKNVKKWNNGKTRIDVGQKAGASNNQGGNSIAINAVEIGVVRIRPQ